MSRAERMKKLVELSDKKVEDASLECQQIRSEYQQSVSQLNSLEQYQHEYGVRLNQPNTEINATWFKDRMTFLDQLQTAIDGQSDVIDHNKTKVEASQEALNQQQRNKMALEKVADKFSQQEKAEAEQKEQAAMDDLARIMLVSRQNTQGKE